MNIFEYLKIIDRYVERREWACLEMEFDHLCSVLAGGEIAALIRRVNLEEYRNKLSQGIINSLKVAKENNYAAIYFEYDLYNHWDSNFFLCKNYTTKLESAINGDDWACYFEEHIKGPSMDEFARLYAISGFDSTKEELGKTLFLIIRTIVAFGTASVGIDTGNIALCMAFHDQDPIIRILE